MSKRHRIEHEFVEFIPNELADGRVYVSVTYATAVHKCLCGCGELVVTPISPADWQLTFDGETISLHPSIGNWNFPCRSHYWIRQDMVQWAGDWSDEQVAAGRARDGALREAYFEGKQTDKDDEVSIPPRREGLIRTTLNRISNLLKIKKK